MNIDELKNQLRPLGGRGIYPLSTIQYFKYYGLDLAGDAIEHRLGTFRSSEFTLCGHIFIPLETGCSKRPAPLGVSLTGFIPKEYKAAAIVLHGYMSHCGLLSKIIKYLLDCGFAVCCFDLPGHGLSDGERTSINDFSQYSDCLRDFINTIRPYVKAPYHLIGHSTGSAIAMDYLFAGREDCFDKIVLAAPLVRSCGWKMSKLGVAIFSRFCQRLSRVYRKTSSDREFLRFQKYRDPLSAKKFSLKWASVMFEWNDKIAEAERIDRPIMIIQGKKDNIVDWRYNLPIIMSKFRDCDIKLLKNARHELFNESAQYRDEVFSMIKQYLSS
jgi:alpha-beta hydrolase superfamily lysophospholipase